MPIYEFRCNGCGCRSSIFQRRIGSEVSGVCPQCHGSDLQRLISQFAVLRSAADAFDDSAMAGLDADDPAAMERWARSMGEEMGGELGSGLDGAFDDGESDGFGADDFDQ
jgi:putative FmdB family regulatory protein